MATLVLRLIKGTPLTNTETDTNFTNLNDELITKLPSASYTASDVLNKVKSVDGVGSGLDADLVIGLSALSALPSATNKSSVMIRDSSGNVTANVFTGALLGNVTGNVSGTSSNVSGTVAIINGGTGATTTSQALTNLGGAPQSNPSFLGTITSVGSFIEFGRVDGTASTPSIDFHSGATAIDYDTRIISNNPTGSIGGGFLEVISGKFKITANAVGNASLEVNNSLNNNGANILLVGNGPNTPNKTIRASYGNLDFINSNYNAVIATITDAGNFTATGNVTAFSDARVKTNIKLIPNALDKVNSIRGVSFDRTDIDSHQIGVIAQEIKEVLPEVVLADANGNLSVAYGNIVAVLIEAIKELSDKVKVLENR